MFKIWNARRTLKAAIAHHNRVIDARYSARQSDAPERVIRAYDSAVEQAERGWADAVQNLAGVL